jgi:hypothetical protein
LGVPVIGQGLEVVQQGPVPAGPENQAPQRIAKGIAVGFGRQGVRAGGLFAEAEGQGQLQGPQLRLEAGPVFGRNREVDVICAQLQAFMDLFFQGRARGAFD